MVEDRDPLDISDGVVQVGARLQDCVPHATDTCGRASRPSTSSARIGIANDGPNGEVSCPKTGFGVPCSERHRWAMMIRAACLNCELTADVVANRPAIYVTTTFPRPGAHAWS